MRFIRNNSRVSLVQIIKNNGYLQFFGPAIVVSVAYMDPGNFGTDISGGAIYEYKLLWVVWLANLMAMLLQYLSGKIGIITGKSLAMLTAEKLKSHRKIILYWLASETFAVATDLAEFLGVASALYLIFKIPLLIASWIAAFDVIIIFALAGKRFRHVELLITYLVSVIGFGYIYEILITKPDYYRMVYHSFVPVLTTNEELFIAVGIIGATVMPHALMLHSRLTKNKLKYNNDDEKRKLLRYHLYDTVLNFTLAGLVNVAIMVMAAAAFYKNGIHVATIDEAYITLEPLFGIVASQVFAITLLASGLSSSTTGVLAGQAILEDLLGSKVSPWIRRIIIRVINVIPTSIAITLGYDPLSLLVYSQVILSMMIPLPLIPLIYFTSNKRIMGMYTNKKITTILSLISTIIIIALNAYLLLSFII
ncbi:MAG: Nramp family divalent metal transporter [Thermoprotei archaeon]